MDLGGSFKGKDGQSPAKPTANTPCAIPALQQVVSVTKGATDAFSNFGKNVNVTIRRFGEKRTEACRGHGIGFSHGFGVGLTSKPQMVHQFKTCVGLAMLKMMIKLGLLPSFPVSQSMIPGVLQSSVRAISAASDSNLQTSVGNVMRLVTKTADSLSHSPGNEGTPSDASIGYRSEKVIRSFLRNPILNEEAQLNDMAAQLRSEKGMLQILLRHQKLIEELVEENKKLRRILVEDLKVPPNKLQASNENIIKSNTPCSDIECRTGGTKSPAS